MSDTGAPVAANEVVIRNDEGEARVIGANSDELSQAQAAGYHPESDEEFTRRKREEKFGGVGGGVAAGVAGVARGLTLGGLSDVALTKMGIVEPETLEALKAVHPVASVAGEVAGTVGGALATGGLGTAGAAVKGGALLGRAAEGLVTRSLGEGLAKRLIAKGAGAAAESALYGVGQVASEDALGEHDMTAEHLMSTVGFSMLMGGGVAAGLHGGGAAIRRIVKAVGKGSEAAATGAEKAFSALGQDVEPGLMKSAVEAAGNGEGTFTAKIGGHDVGISKEGLQDVSNKVYENIKFFDDTVNKFSRNVSEARPKEVAAALEGVDPAPAVSASRKIADDVAAKIAEATDNARYDQTTIGGAKEALFGKMKKLSPEEIEAGLTDRQYGKGSLMETIVDPESSANDIHSAMTEFKRMIADDAQYARKNPFSKPSEKRASDLIKEFYDAVKTHLEDTQIYGEAGASQAALNRSIADKMRAAETFKREFYSHGELDSKKVMTYIRQMDTEAGITRANALTKHMDAGMSLFQEGSKTLKATGSALDGTEASNAHSQLKIVRAQAIEAVSQLNKLRQYGFLMPELGERTVEGTISMGHRILGAVEHPVGAAVELAKTITTPKGVVSILGAINRASHAAQEKIIGGADKLLATQLGKRAARLPPILSTEIASHTSGLAKAHDNIDSEPPVKMDKSTIHQRATQIIDAANDPRKLQDMVAHSIAGLDQAAPKIAGHVAALQTRAILFLADKAPRDPVDPFQPGARKPEQKAKLASFARYLAAVENPHSIMDDARHGRLSQEGVEAVRTIYPRMYGQMVQAVLGRVAKQTEPLPHQQRARLSRLLGVPLEPLNDPANLAILRQAAAVGGQKVAAQEAAAAPQTKSLNTSKLKFGGDSATTQQRLMAG